MLLRVISISFLFLSLACAPAQADLILTSKNAKKTAAKLELKNVEILSDYSLLYKGSPAKANALGVKVENNDTVRSAVVPDELFGNKQSYWQHRNSWSGSGQISSPLAWNYSSGQGQVVAVVDSGVNFQSRDLASQQWINPDETSDGLDNDGNGIVDDLNGARLSRGLLHGDSSDSFGHGTSVSSLIASRANNGGLVGVAPSAQIMSVRILDDKGVGSEADLVAGIDYAVKEGAKIINLSLISDSLLPSPAIQASIDEAARQDILVVIAAGNRARDVDSRPVYPVALPGNNIVAVGASDKDDHRASFSNFGLRNVDLFAPGDNIIVLKADGSRAAESGTSLSAPIVAGAAALLRAYNPSLSAPSIRQVLIQTADKKDFLSGLAVSGGRLNIGRAAESVSKIRVALISSPARDRAILRRNDGKLTIKFQSNSSATESLYLDGKLKLRTKAKAGRRISKLVKVARGKHLLRIVTRSGESSVTISRIFNAK